MNQETKEIIQEIAEKLGTTAEHLWGVLIKQAGINAITDVIIATITICVFAFTFKYVMKKTHVPEKTEEERYPTAEWDDELGVLAHIILLIFAIIAASITLASIYTVITALLNPEYWALKQIIG